MLQLGVTSRGGKLESIISKIWKNSDAEIESKDSHSRRLAKKERDEVGCYQ